MSFENSPLHRVLVRVGSICMVVLAACSPTPVPETGPEPEPLVFETLGAGQHGARVAPIFEAFRDSVAWAAASADFSPVRPLPRVDFSQSMVIALADTVRSGGYSIEVRSVDLLPDGIVVDYTLLKPADDCIQAMAEAFPFLIIKARQAEGDVRFVRNVEPYRCTFN